ncbi:MAG: hypothetical protein A2X86_20530 [Bdellovibrionales bacterium GWA2_49_15]|nr:MAG: hypothetical protein A2X86_20530 [Bdellovibrionales bacterium GWA2_49_15]HAZ11298.1 hypothetical protein [Bdellovibrionales bacterium]
MSEMNSVIPLVDIHTHGVLSSASEKNIVVFAESPGLIKRPPSYQGLYTFGFHPWCADRVELEGTIEKEFKARLGDPKLLAFGEMGLDRACQIDFEMQRKIFIAQVEICTQLRTPLIVLHCVRAHSDIMGILKRSHFEGAILFHDFNGDKAVMKQLSTLKNEVLFSLGANLFRSNSAVVNHLSLLPLDKIFLETDDCTRSIAEVYQRFALLSEQKLPQVTEAIYRNFKRVFPMLWGKVL